VDDLGDISDAADAAEAASLADLPSLEELGYDLDALEDVEALPFDVADPFDDADPLTVPVEDLWVFDDIYSNATEVEWDPAAFRWVRRSAPAATATVGGRTRLPGPQAARPPSRLPPAIGPDHGARAAVLAGATSHPRNREHRG
jgi:hypothetical protein